MTLGKTSNPPWPTKCLINCPRRNDWSKVFRQAVSYCLKVYEDHHAELKSDAMLDPLRHEHSA